MNIKIQKEDVVAMKCSIKELFRKTLQNSEENSYAGVSFY